MKRLSRKRREPARKRPGVRQPSAALEFIRKRLDAEIDIGLAQLKRGEKIPGAQVFAEIQERSRRKRNGEKV